MRRRIKPGESRRSHRRRDGMILLEILVSLSVISVFGLVTLSSLMQSHRSVQMARASDREFIRAVALLDAAMLWSRRDLNQRLGDRRQGDWMMRIDRRWPDVYEITVLDSSATRALLSTTVGRDEGAGS